jgi:hypothetical protein
MRCVYGDELSVEWRLSMECATRGIESTREGKTYPGAVCVWTSLIVLIGVGGKRDGFSKDRMQG